MNRNNQLWITDNLNLICMIIGIICLIFLQPLSWAFFGASIGISIQRILRRRLPDSVDRRNSIMFTKWESNEDQYGQTTEEFWDTFVADKENLNPDNYY